MVKQVAMTHGQPNGSLLTVSRGFRIVSHLKDLPGGPSTCRIPGPSRSVSPRSPGAPEPLTGLAVVGEAGSVSLGVDGHHGDGVLGVREQLVQQHLGGALRHLLLRRGAECGSGEVTAAQRFSGCGRPVFAF